MDKFKLQTGYDIIYSFFENMTSTSTTFLSGSSAVVAALLALTTIIFSQFNERLIQKTSNISREIKMSISEEKNNYQIIIDKVNEIIYLLLNQSVYKMTLYFFFFISYLSGILWIMSGVGNFLELPQKSYGDFTVIILSTLAISLTFFGLPILLIKFNKNPVLKVDNKNRVSFFELIKYFNSISRVSNESIIKDYIQPSLTFSLGYSGELILSVKQEIPISKITYVFEFVGTNNIKQLVKITHNVTETFVEYEINPSKKNGNSFEGAFNLIRESTHQNLYVYHHGRRELVSSFTLQFLKNTETKVILNIKEQYRLTPDEDATNILTSKKWMHMILEDNKDEYKLKQKK